MTGTSKCFHCFKPIGEGQGRVLRSRAYHKECVETMLENFREDFKKAKGKDLPGIMTDMERVFDIPMLKNSEYDSLNADVIEFYKEVSNARDL